MSGAASREAQLAAQGWTKQFMTDEPRLSEAVAQYRALGFEVRLEPLEPAACAGGSDCAACLAEPAAAARCKVIYTRRPPD
jgi:hypothetical protein